MTPDERLYISQRFKELHEEIHSIAIDVAEIKQWKKDQDEFESSMENNALNKRETFFGILGGIGVIAGIIIAFI